MKTLTVEAVYENGVLKPAVPLPLKEHEKVRVSLETLGQAADEAERAVRRSHGLVGWTGDLETLRRVAEDPEFDPQELLPLKEHETVQVPIQPKANWVEATYGILGFTGSVEVADYFAMDPELDFPPPPEEPRPLHNS